MRIRKKNVFWKLEMEAANLEESDLKGMEVCNFGGTELALPIDLIEQVN